MCRRFEPCSGSQRSGFVAFEAANPLFLFPHLWRLGGSRVSAADPRSARGRPAVPALFCWRRDCGGRMSASAGVVEWGVSGLRPGRQPMGPMPRRARPVEPKQADRRWRRIRRPPRRQRARSRSCQSAAPALGGAAKWREGARRRGAHSLAARWRGFGVCRVGNACDRGLVKALRPRWAGRWNGEGAGRRCDARSLAARWRRAPPCNGPTGARCSRPRTMESCEEASTPLPVGVPFAKDGQQSAKSSQSTFAAQGWRCAELPRHDGRI